MFGEEAEVRLTLEGPTVAEDNKATMADQTEQPPTKLLQTFKHPAAMRSMAKSPAVAWASFTKSATANQSHPGDEGHARRSARRLRLDFLSSLSRFPEFRSRSARPSGQVAVHELGLDAAGRPYFTMKLVKGRDSATSSNCPRRAGRLNLPRAVGALIKACQAVAFAHSKGVIHRDLAGQRRSAASAKLCDGLGLAKVTGRKTCTISACAWLTGHHH
jgi:serine/threonine protein kinase